MNIVHDIVIFYIHTILHLVPYLASGIAVYLYFLYKRVVEYNAAIAGYVEQFGGTREDAIKNITSDPII